MQAKFRKNNINGYKIYSAKNSGSGAVKLILALAIVAAAGVGYLIWSKNSSRVDTNPQVIIVAITPNYSTIKIPSQNCKVVTTTKSVKNPDSGFFSSMFDSKNHPKYIKQSSSKRVCQQGYTESQVVDNYTISYRFKQFVESMVVVTPPPLNQVMHLTDLQKYQNVESMNNVTNSK